MIFEGAAPSYEGFAYAARSCGCPPSNAAKDATTESSVRYLARLPRVGRDPGVFSKLRMDPGLRRDDVLYPKEVSFDCGYLIIRWHGLSEVGPCLSHLAGKLRLAHATR